MLTYLDLFSGIGGFALGIHRALLSRQTLSKRAVGQGLERPRCGIDTNDVHGGVCVGFAEIDWHAIGVYRSHFPSHPCLGDITTVGKLPSFDLLTAGFPCQAFSRAGDRGGFDDPRGALFFEIVRILHRYQPRLFLLENVAGLLDHERGATFTHVLTALSDVGYDVEWQVLDSKYFGVPQHRERVYLVGHSRSKPSSPIFPIVPIAGTYGEPPREHGTIRHFTALEYERLQGFPDGWTAGLRDTHRFRLLGNAVTVPVISELVSRML